MNRPLLAIKMLKRAEFSTDFENAVLQQSKEGRLLQSEIAHNFEVYLQLVSSWQKRFVSRDTTNSKPRSGRPRKTSEETDRIIRRLSTGDVQRSAVYIKNELEGSRGVAMSISTVKRRLKTFGLHERGPARKPLKSIRHGIVTSGPKFSGAVRVNLT